jgi:hypothetical protein
MYRTFAAGMAFVLSIGLLVADDKKDPKDKSDLVAWERETNGIDLKLEVGKDVLIVHVFSGENGMILKCKTTKDKDGLVKATVTGVEEKGNFPAKPKEGFEFSFKWKVEGDTATLSDLMGEGVEDAKAVAEGEYKKKK